MKTPLLALGILGLLPASLLAADPALRPVTGTESRPLKVIETETAHYPAMMCQRGVKYGRASIILSVSATGQLTDTLVTSYSHEAFGREVQRVVKQWKFEPALEQGRPVGTQMNIEFNFEVQGVLVIDRRDIDVHEREVEWSDRLTYQPLGVQELDAVPRPVKVVSPSYPQEWLDQGITGLLTVEFYIDETGRPRMATCVTDGDPRLAGIALAAVRQWEFTPPTAQGKPVLVHARQQFSFGVKT